MCQKSDTKSKVTQQEVKSSKSKDQNATQHKENQPFNSKTWEEESQNDKQVSCLGAAAPGITVPWGAAVEERRWACSLGAPGGSLQTIHDLSVHTGFRRRKESNYLIGKFCSVYWRETGKRAIIGPSFIFSHFIQDFISYLNFCKNSYMLSLPLISVAPIYSPL